MSTTQRLRDATTGLLATAVLLTVVFGVPVALVRLIGWPLPTDVPSVSAVIAALRYGHVAPTTLLEALAVVVWVLWLLMTIGIALELLALARGTVARKVPTLAGLQQVCARLLTAAMLLSTLTTRPALAVSTPAVPATAPAAAPAPPAPAGDDVPAAGSWVVRRHESLWAIAERALGDGRRWREIRDLNVGRPQPGGGRLREGDTLIHPGWVLRLPPGAAARAEPDGIEVERGDHLWGLAEAHLGDGARWRDLYERNRDVRQPDGRRLRRPDLIRPGWVLSLPDAATAPMPPEPRDRRRTGRADDAAAGDQRARPHHDAPVPTPPVIPRTLPRPGSGATETTTPSPVPPGGPGPAAVAPAAPEPDVVVASAERPEQRLTLPAAGSALLAAGLVAMLARRRRQWLRRRRPGSVLDPVEAEAAELERWLRSMAEHDLSHRTDRLLRLLTGHFAEHDVRPAVLAVQIGERVTLLLADPERTPPPGFTASDDGSTWLVDPELEVAAPHDEGLPPFIPARVACGVQPTGDIVVLNLMAAGVLTVEGEAPAVDEALTSWTAELASGGAAAGVELVVVGRHHHVVEQFARVVVADDPTAALARVERMLARTPDRALSHVVVLSATPARGPAWDVLRRRAGDEPRLALVTAWDPGDAQSGSGTGRRLRLDGEHVVLDPPGLRLAAPEWLTPRTWEHMGDLLAQPTRERPSALVPSPLLTGPLDRHPDATWDDVGREPSDRMVRVLGPLAVEGIAAEPPCTPDVLAYLAVHRDGVELSTLAGEVAPGPSGAAAVRSAVAALRDGDDPVVITRDGRLRLADDVGSDLGHLNALTCRLDHQAPAEQVGTMQAALTLVRGRPFEGCGAWADAEGLPTVTAALVADVAHRLATVVTTFGDLERASWAVDRGLLANPGCELLYRDRMRVADAAGDHAALHAALREVREHAAADDGWVSAETLQLFEQLTRSTTIAVPPGDDFDGHRHAS